MAFTPDFSENLMASVILEIIPKHRKWFIFEAISVLLRPCFLL